MIRKELESIVWLEFELLNQFSQLNHGILLRHGGQSEGAFTSLNLGFTQDNVSENQNVQANRNKVNRVFNLKNVTQGQLEHGDHVVEINAHNHGSRPLCDALTTKEEEITLITTFADCQAAIFYDPVEKAIANVHSGWRGNVKNIYGKTIQFMKNRYGSSPSNIHVGISPSLGPNDAEFKNYQQELPQSFWDFQIQPFFFDLWSISQNQLIEAGALKEHIQIAGISTLSNPDDYFSYRREKITGRHGQFVSLKKSYAETH